jgi:hypothetical protein
MPELKLKSFNWEESFAFFKSSFLTKTQVSSGFDRNFVPSCVKARRKAWSFG